MGAGPLAWLAQIPFLELPRLATGGATLPQVALAAQTGVASTALAVGATVGAMPVGAPPVEVQATTVSVPPADDNVVLDTGAERSPAADVVVPVADVPPAVEVRSDEGTEHGQGVGSDDRAAREAARAAEQAQRDQEAAVREARRQAEQEQRDQEAADRAARQQAEQEQRDQEAADRDRQEQAEQEQQHQAAEQDQQPAPEPGDEADDEHDLEVTVGDLEVTVDLPDVD